jgi:hypothetical protein
MSTLTGNRGFEIDRLHRSLSRIGTSTVAEPQKFVAPLVFSTLVHSRRRVCQQIIPNTFMLGQAGIRFSCWKDKRDDRSARAWAGGCVVQMTFSEEVFLNIFFDYFFCLFCFGPCPGGDDHFDHSVSGYYRHCNDDHGDLEP